MSNRAYGHQNHSRNCPQCARRHGLLSADNFRQLLGRARRDLYEFMQGKCGLVNSLNPCRCSKKAGAFMQQGWLDPKRRQFTSGRIATVRDVTPDRLEELRGLQRAHAEVYRDTPLAEPPDAVRRLREVVAKSTFALD